MTVRGRTPDGSPLTGLVPTWFDPGIEDGRLRLHIGGTETRPGWRILNIQSGDGVDFVGDCTDLTRFDDRSVSAVYASHVLEHLAYREELPSALAEIRRVLAADGVLLMSVPDMELLCTMFLDKEISLQDRHTIMMILFGGQIDAHDFHRVGLWRDYLATLLRQAGFVRVNQVPAFGMFEDSSSAFFRDRYISLNLIVS